MANLNLVQNSFTQGELTEKLNGRFDVPALYNSGCSELKNFIVAAQGGIDKRIGTRYISTAAVPDQEVRLIPFEFSDDDSYVLEFGDEYIRFYTDGGIIVNASGIPYQITSPYEADDLAEVKFVQAADTFYLCHPAYPVKKLVRISFLNWEISNAEMVNGPWLDINVTDAEVTPSTVTGTITLTASTPLFTPFHIGAYFRLESSNAVTTVASAADVFTTPVEVDKGETINVSAIGTSGWSATVVVQKTTDGGTTWTDLYVQSINFAINITESLNDDAFYRIGISTYSSGDITLRLETLDAWGYVEITDYVSTTEVEAEVKRSLPSTSSTTKWSEGAWSPYRGFPAAVAFFEQRLVLAGSDFEPQDIWASKVNDYQNFKLGTLDTDAYNFTLVSNSLNKIIWLLENRILHAGTSAGEWNFGYPDQPTTPSNVNARQPSKLGSSKIQALSINNNIVFIQNGDDVLKSKIFDYNSDGYKSFDLSPKSEHLLQSGIKEVVFQNGTTPVIWLLTNNGDLVGVTYLPDQQLISFHQHDTQGYFESITSIPGDDMEELWVVVKRTIDGTDTRYIEQFQTHLWDNVEDAYYSDCSIPYDGEELTTFSGAEHLEGLTCKVLVDGATAPDVTISGGSFTLESPAKTKVILGLGYDAVMSTMPILPIIEQGTSMGKNKNIWKVILQLYKTIDIKVGSSLDEVDIVPFRSSEDFMDEGLPVYTGLVDIEFEGGYEESQTVTILSDQPLPCSVSSLSFKFYSGPNR